LKNLVFALVLSAMPAFANQELTPEQVNGIFEILLKQESIETDILREALAWTAKMEERWELGRMGSANAEGERKFAVTKEFKRLLGDSVRGLLRIKVLGFAKQAGSQTTYRINDVQILWNVPWQRLDEDNLEPDLPGEEKPGGSSSTSGGRLKN